MSTTVTFNVLASTDDGTVGYSGSTYPPSSNSLLETGGSTMDVFRYFDVDYMVLNGLLRFDTSSIPDSATILSAVLKFYVYAKTDAEGRSLTADWHNFSSITLSDYSSTALNDAITGVTLSSLTDGSVNSVSLSNVSNVNKTGYTGLRLHISGGQPSGYNILYIRTYDSPNPPQLEVTYQEGTQYEKTLTANGKVTGSATKTVNKTCTANGKATSSANRVTNKLLTALGKATGSVIRGGCFFKELTAIGVSTGSAAKSYVRGKVLTAYGKTTGSVSKNINKLITALSKVTGNFKMSSEYEPIFPKLTVTEYPVGLSFAEYPIETAFTEYPISFTLTEYPIDFDLTEYVIEMEVDGMPAAGSTITLQGTFPNSAGNLSLLADVSLKIYGPGKTLLSTITPTAVTTGVYSAEYTIPADKTGQFDYEFSGTLGTKTIVGRSSFDSIWK